MDFCKRNISKLFLSSLLWSIILSIKLHFNRRERYHPRTPLFAGKSKYNQNDLSIEVVFEDDSIIAISKPSGMVTMPCESAPWTAAHAAAANAGNEEHNSSSTAGDIIKYGVVHRLDKEVSGLLLLAKNQPISKILSKTFSQRFIAKYYLAVVHGDLIDKFGYDSQSYAKVVTLKWPILRKSSGKAAIALQTDELKDAKPAVTKLTLLASNSTYSIVKVSLETGRFHQIRVHMAHLGHPIVGDSEYGVHSKRQNSIKRTMLHSRSISIPHPKTKKIIHLQAGVPHDMENMIKSILSCKCVYLSPELSTFLGIST